MKKLIPVMALVVVVVAIVVLKKDGSGGADVEPIVWYGMMPHPYIAEVQVGAAAAEAATGTKVLKVVGQEWSQDNENANVKALSTKGHKGFSIFPGDPAGANGLFGQLVRNGQFVIAYGAEPNLPSPASLPPATTPRWLPPPY
jgi:ABC-type sugar transport system substrate-binding protein